MSIPVATVSCTAAAQAALPSAMIQRWRALAAVSTMALALASGLAGCGGGSSGTDPAPATTPAPPSAPVTPSITTAPANQSVTEPAAASWTIVASGTPAPALQWQLSTDAGTTWADIPGATAATYTLQPTSLADDGKRVRVIVSSTAASVTSGEATLTVVAATAVDVGDVDARFAAITAVENKLNEFSGQQLPAADRINAIAAFMATRAEYVATGIDAQTLSATGVFRDGRLHVVSLNYTPKAAPASAASAPAAATATTALAARISGPTATQSAASTRVATAINASAAAANTAAGAELPTSPYARLSHSFGRPAGFTFQTQPAIDDAKNYLKAKGWQLRNVAEGDARVTTLRQVSGDGFFQLNTHGALASAGIDPHLEPDGKLFAIGSSTIASPEVDRFPDFAADIAANRLVYLTMPNGTGQRDKDGNFVDVLDTRYALTRYFIERYWSFAPNAVVILNACSSATNSQFVFSVKKAGAGLYLGWTNLVSPDAVMTSLRYFVDRMVGANKYLPESPAQRAFPHDQVLAEMARIAYDSDVETGAKLVASVAVNAASPLILSPSIREMVVDEQANTLKLQGGFGTHKPKVTIGGEPVVLKTWGTDAIVVTLPASGKGSSGDVQVETDGGVKSNLRQLTEWPMSLRYTWTSPMGLTGLLFDGTGTLRFRADIGGYRTDPHVALQYPQRLTYATRDSALTVTGSGSITSANGCTQTLTGSGKFSSALPLGTPIGDLILGNAIRLDTQTRQGAFGLSFGGTSSALTFNITRSGATNCTVSTMLPPFLGAMEGFQAFPGSVLEGANNIPLGAVQVSFNTDFTLIGRNYPVPSAPGGTVRIQWPDVVPIAPPRNDIDSGK